MSLRVSEIQRTMQPTRRTAPAAESQRLSVVPTTTAVMAMAVTSGIAVGPGRWISSLAGVASREVVSSSVIDQAVLYTTAATNERPNITKQTAPSQRPIRMFFLATSLSMGLFL